MRHIGNDEDGDENEGGGHHGMQLDPLEQGLPAMNPGGGAQMDFLPAHFQPGYQGP